ncbi:MAG: DUF2219 family protein [Rhodobacteraceae bacterium]|nr:DUF2219 family protein [Paracoccaceae bacterium]
MALVTGVVAFSTPGVSQTYPAGATNPVDTEYSNVPSPFEDSARRRQIGYGRLFTNDLIGDGKDRWRSGSITASHAYGYHWSGAAPSQFGELLELRLQGEILTPENLKRVNPSDRPWAGALSLGLHTHAQIGGFEYAVGADLVVLGPQTQLDHLQDALHGLVGAPQPSDAVLGAQIGDKIRPTVVAEVARTYGLGGSVDLRPFAELRAGDETLARIGADFTFGQIGRGELLSRESVTGQRYRVIQNAPPGTSFTLGGDIAHVTESVYLPEDRGYSLENARGRVRAGIHWQGESASAFYGLTYLGKEFSGQRESQLTGSVRIKLSF